MKFYRLDAPYFKNDNPLFECSDYHKVPAEFRQTLLYRQDPFTDLLHRTNDVVYMRVRDFAKNRYPDAQNPFGELLLRLHLAVYYLPVEYGTYRFSSPSSVADGIDITPIHSQIYQNLYGDALSSSFVFKTMCGPLLLNIDFFTRSNNSNEPLVNYDCNNQHRHKVLRDYADIYAREMYAGNASGLIDARLDQKFDENRLDFSSERIPLNMLFRYLGLVKGGESAYIPYSTEKYTRPAYDGNIYTDPLAENMESTNNALLVSLASCMSRRIPGWLIDDKIYEFSAYQYHLVAYLIDWLLGTEQKSTHCPYKIFEVLDAAEALRRKSRYVLRAGFTAASEIDWILDNISYSAPFIAARTMWEIYNYRDNLYKKQPAEYTALSLRFGLALHVDSNSAFGISDERLSDLSQWDGLYNDTRVIIHKIFSTTNRLKNLYKELEKEAVRQQKTNVIYNRFTNQLDNLSLSLDLEDLGNITQGSLSLDAAYLLDLDWVEQVFRHQSNFSFHRTI